MEENTVLRVVARFLMPFILLYALYIQFHGEISPGGGFQAGVLFASAFFLHALIFGIEKTKQVVPIHLVKILSSAGVLLYIAIGFVTLFRGGQFLEYSVLASNAVTGQQWGIFLIELGIGITVFAVMMLTIYVFAGRK